MRRKPPPRMQKVRRCGRRTRRIGFGDTIFRGGVVDHDPGLAGAESGDRIEQHAYRSCGDRIGRSLWVAVIGQLTADRCRFAGDLETVASGIRQFVEGDGVAVEPVIATEEPALFIGEEVVSVAAITTM